MKLVFNNYQMRQLAGWCAVAFGLAFLPANLSASDPVQQQPAQQTQQEAQEFTKTIKKEFAISATGTVDLVNKYGKVDVHTWDRNRVKIDVTIVVKARSESSAQNVFDRINIDFDNDDDYVKAATTIESSKGGWWNSGNNNSEFQINYDVFMPESCNLELSNKYGNSMVEAISGGASVKVKYGNFQLDGVGGELNVSLGYGNGTVVKARDVDATVSYSKLNLNDVQDVNFATKYSKLYVDKGATIKADCKYDHLNLTDIDRLNCQSRYGNVEIGSAESVIGVSQYTDYRIDQLSDNGDFTLRYGGLKVEKLAKGFSTVNLNGEYSDFKVYVEPGASFVLDGMTSYAGIAYPAGMDVTYEKEKSNSHEVKGHVGTKDARSTIKAKLKYGGLKIRQQ